MQRMDYLSLFRLSCRDDRNPGVTENCGMGIPMYMRMLLRGIIIHDCEKTFNILYYMYLVQVRVTLRQK